MFIIDYMGFFPMVTEGFITLTLVLHIVEIIPL